MAVGIRVTPSPASLAGRAKFQGREITGPPPSERGRTLQRRRIELEKISEKVTVSDGKVDFSKLSSFERARVRTLTGISAEKAFTIKTVPQTREEFQRSLFARQEKVKRVAKLTAKLQARDVEVRGLETVKAELLTERARATKEAQLKKAGGEVIFKPSEAFFGIVPTGVGVKKVIPTESELIQELKAQKGFVTFVAPKKKPEEPERKIQVSIFKPTERFKVTEIGKVPTRLELFEERVEEQKKRQREFFESAGFERVSKLSSFITGGARIQDGKLVVIPKEERGPVGRVATSVTEFFAAGPLVIGGTIGLTFEKLKLTGEALTIPEISKRDIGREFLFGPPKRIVTAFVELPPTEKVALGISVAIAPFLGGGALRQFLGKRVTRTKAIEELTLAETTKLERFELSVSELKGVRVQPKKLNLQEVERLSPKAAKAVEAVILKNKQNVVVGGSVAQRTQIKGKSRIPEDIDIFTSKEPKQLLRELETELKKQGVKRVSLVRDKQITIEGKKSIEVKKVALLQQNIAKVQLPFETFGSALATTPRGVKVLRLGAQAQRKVVGGFGLERERIRFKDIKDLPDILRQLRKSRRATFIPRRPRPREPFAIPSQLPKPLKAEPPSFIFGRTGRPSGVGGVLPSRLTPISISPFEVSGLRPLRDKPSRLLGAPTDISRVTGFEPTPLSLLIPTPKGAPSILGPTPPSRITPSRITPLGEPPVQPPGRRIIILRDKEKPRLRQKPAFRIEVREGLTKADKFIRVPGFPLPRQSAINKGARIVDRTTARSFRIKPKGKTRLPDDRSFPLMNKFRARRGKTRLPPKTFVELSKFAIDSGGERAGIPFSPQRLPALRMALERKRVRKEKRITRQVQRPIKPIPEPMIPNPIMINNRRGGVMKFL